MPLSKVALKLIDKAKLEDAESVKRVAMEIANMKELKGHPNIVNIYDCKQEYVHIL